MHRDSVEKALIAHDAFSRVPQAEYGQYQQQLLGSLTLQSGELTEQEQEANATANANLLTEFVGQLPHSEIIDQDKEWGYFDSHPYEIHTTTLGFTAETQTEALALSRTVVWVTTRGAHYPAIPSVFTSEPDLYLTVEPYFVIGSRKSPKLEYLMAPAIVDVEPGQGSPEPRQLLVFSKPRWSRQPQLRDPFDRGSPEDIEKMFDPEKQQYVVQPSTTGSKSFNLTSRMHPVAQLSDRELADFNVLHRLSTLGHAFGRQGALRELLEASLIEAVVN